jgi:hypothetical protein
MFMELQISEVAWILGGNTGTGAALLEDEHLLKVQTDDNMKLASFSAKPYLNSMKGFLDPAGHFTLAACSLLKKAAEDKSGETGCTGIAALTRYGAGEAAFTFFSQLVQKGPRLASPLIFPHSYASTAPNLAAIEFGWNGPHMIYFGKQDCREPFEFAAVRLAEDSAQSMIILAFEAAPLEMLPESQQIRNGAMTLLLQKASERPARLRFTLQQLRALPPVTSGMGSVQDTLLLLATLATKNFG